MGRLFWTTHGAPACDHKGPSKRETGMGAELAADLKMLYCWLEDGGWGHEPRILGSL